MLSSDQNVETIAKLVKIVKHYLGLQTEYLKLDVIDKLVRLLTFFALATVFFMTIVAVVTYCSFAFAFWLGAYIGNVAAFFIVGAVHFCIFLLILTFRKTLIVRPLLHFLANLLMS